MQTCVPQIAVLKDLHVFSWEIDIFSDCCFQEHFEITTSAFYPMAQNMSKGDIKTIQSPVLRHSFIHCPQTSLCQLWTDIFNRVLEYVSQKCAYEETCSCSCTHMHQRTVFVYTSLSNTFCGFCINSKIDCPKINKLLILPTVHKKWICLHKSKG